MNLIKSLLTSAGMLLATAGTAMAVPLAMLQEPTLKVEVHTNEAQQAVWYTNPMWLAIGGVAVLLIIVLVVLAARGRDSTTVVR